mgnify:CR=1 FL=1
MCDSTKCDDCGRFNPILSKVVSGWYVCITCKEKRDRAE